MADEKEKGKDQAKKYVFGSKFAGYLLVLEPGGPKYIDGQYIPKMPFKGVTFSNGVLDTTDATLAAELRKSPMFGKDFWEIKETDDARKVNPGRQIDAAEGVKGTGHVPSKNSQ